MRISDWSSDVCSSDLCVLHVASLVDGDGYASDISDCQHLLSEISYVLSDDRITLIEPTKKAPRVRSRWGVLCNETEKARRPGLPQSYRALTSSRSEEHTSELQSLMRTSYAVFCLKKKTPQ